MSQDNTVASFLAKRRDNFLLLRILAAVAVIYGHSYAIARAGDSVEWFVGHGWPMYSGDMAVAMFFVISGFMVSGSYLARDDLFEFAKARVLRIVPALVLVVVMSAFVIGPALTTMGQADYWRSPGPFTYVIKNLRFSSDMAWQLPGVFEGHPKQAINGSLWTLPAEMRMYVLTAAVGAVGLLASRIAGSVALVALLALGTAGPDYFPLHQDWVRLAGYFALGILVQLNKGSVRITHAGMLMLAFLTYISMRTRSADILFGVTLAYFCFWFAYRTPTWRGLARAGDPSYGIYLWGWPAQQVLVACFPSILPWQNFLGAAVLAIFMGYASWWFVERWALELRGWHPRAMKRFVSGRFFAKGSAR